MALGANSFGGIVREVVKDVKRGRMYDRVDDCGGGGAGVLGRPGGGNHRARDSRTQSDVTWRLRCRSAFDPTM